MKECYTCEDVPYIKLGLDIVNQAISDWRMLCKWRNPWSSDSKLKLDDNTRQAYIRSLRNFFSSEWCGVLLGCSDFNPHILVMRLDKEWEKAKRRHMRT